MALNHFIASIMYIIFGGAEWILIKYMLDRFANFFITNYNSYVSVPHVSFMLAIVQWGAFLLVFLPTGIYLWTQTQRPEAF